MRRQIPVTCVRGTGVIESDDNRTTFQCDFRESTRSTAHIKHPFVRKLILMKGLDNSVFHPELIQVSEELSLPLVKHWDQLASAVRFTFFSIVGAL